MRAASWLCLLVLGCASAPPRTDPADRDPLLHRAAVNGTELAYTVEGAGPPLVIIHGWLSDYRSFSQVAAVVARSRTVVRLSLRLHHPNPWPGSGRAAAETYRVENHAADVAGLIQRLGLGPADVVGHSYGGIVAALVARAHPELVRSLILIEPSLFGLIHDRRVGAETLSGFEDGRMRTLAQLASGKPALDVIREIFGSEAFDQFGELRRQIIVDNANTLAPSQAESWWALPFSCADARAFGMPVQLIEGAATFAVAREIQQELLRCVNDGQRVVIPRAGHTVQFDAPEATGRAILRFVTGGT